MTEGQRIGRPAGRPTCIASRVIFSIPDPKPVCQVDAKKRFLSGARRESTRRIGEELWSILKDGEAVVNVSELARRSGYSRPTIYRALAFFQQFGKILAVDGYHTGQGHPGRPVKYRLNPAYTIKEKQPANSEEKGVSSKRVNPFTEPQEDLKQEPPSPAKGPVLLNENDERLKLTRWLCQADVHRPPTDQERRKLSVAVRLTVPPIVADSLLDALWWRTKAPLRLWRDVLGAVWRGVSVPDASEKALVWTVRHGLKRLAQTGDRKAFLDALENEPLEAKKRRTERRLQSLRRWRIAQGADCAGEVLSWFVERRRELERIVEGSRVEDPRKPKPVTDPVEVHPSTLFGKRTRRPGLGQIVNQRALSEYIGEDCDGQAEGGER